MSAASQASAFFREAVESRTVWTIRDEGGFPAPLNPDGRRSQPFWSSKSRAERIVRCVPAYHCFHVVPLELNAFHVDWLPGLERDRILVGLNWSGPNARGYDVEPNEAAASMAYALSRGA